MHIIHIEHILIHFNHFSKQITMKTVKERLIEFLKQKGIGQAKFAETVGLSRGFVNSISQSIQPKTLDRISIHYPELNKGWLLTGEGSMLVSEPDTAQPKKGDVPFYDVDFAASYLDYYNDERQPGIDHYVNIPQADGASLVCRASGESMAPTIPNGSHVILSEVNDFRWLDYGEIYALVASNGLRTIKRIRKNEDESKLTLVPDNPDYDINEIDKADVLRLFRVVGTIQFATP